MKSASILFLLVFLLMCFSESEGQVLGRRLEKGNLQIGYFRKSVHRKLEPAFLSGDSWGGRSLYAKYGVYSWASLSVEGSLFDNIKYSEYPNSEYRILTLGAGIDICILRIQGLRSGLGLYYNEILWFDKSMAAYHFDVREILGVMQIEQVLSLRGQDLALWMAPAYVRDEIVQYSCRHRRVRKNKSFNNFGFAFGANLLLFDHVEPFFHFVYADFLQPRVGIAYQF